MSEECQGLALRGGAGARKFGQLELCTRRRDVAEVPAGLYGITPRRGEVAFGEDVGLPPTLEE